MAESPSEECRIPEETKKSVRAVLLSKIGGVPLDRFASDFKKLAGFPLHYKEHGFSSLREVLEAMPDAVRFNYSDEASKWMLYGIGDSKSYMSSAAKKAQFSKPGDGTKDTTNRKRNRKKFNKSNNGKGDNSPVNQVNQQSRSKQTVKADVIKGDGSNNNKGDNTSPRLNTEQRDEKELRVPQSNRGFYSVCVHYTGNFSDSKHKIMQEIVELFATQGDVIEKSCVKSLMFFRFLTEEEAISVIKLYNGRRLSDGKEIRVTPATEKMASGKKSAEQFEGIPSKDRQREQQQHMLQQILLQQQQQQEQQIFEQHQILQQYGEPWPSEAYPYLHAYEGMQEAYLGIHGEQFLDRHPDYNHHDEGHDPPSVVEMGVFNIGKEITKEDLLSLFWGFNPLNVRLRSKQGDGNNRRYFAFVAFGCLADALNAEASLQNTMVKGRYIKMEVAKTKAHSQRSSEEQARLQKAKELDNQKPRSEQSQMKDPPQSCKSEEDESSDSISAEIIVSENSDDNSPPYMHNEVAVIDDSPYSLKTHHLDDTLSSGGSEGSTVSGLQDGGMMFGRGRGSMLGHVSPSLGRGLALLNAGMEKKKKKLRPSLADLADKLHEL